MPAEERPVSPTNKELLDALKEIELAFADYCCDNCISEIDLEVEHPRLLTAIQTADQLIMRERKANDGN